MAKKNEDLISQIANSKQRLSEWPHGVAHIARLVAIRRDLAEIKPKSGLRWYLPVALVSCIESFFKQAFADLIDSGAPYLERVTDLKGNQLRLEDLMLLETRDVSIGEFIAQQQSYSSLEALNRTAKTLSDEDFLKALKQVQAVMPWQERPQRKAILSDPGATYNQVKECFNLRHIVCHEAPPREPLGQERAEELLMAVDNFLSASFYWFARFLLQHVPATHSERKKVRISEARQAKEILESTATELVQVLPPERHELFNQSQAAWEKFAQLDAEFAGSIFAGGLMESEERFRQLAWHRKSRVQALKGFRDQEQLT